MAPVITELSPAETREVMDTKKPSAHSKVVDHLMAILDTPSSIFVVGMTDAAVNNTLRARMGRKGVTLNIKKATRDGTPGHVILAKTTPED